MNIKFIDYDGSFPNLCSGTLILEIDGEVYSFGGFGPFEDPKHQFPSFWESGGSIGGNCEDGLYTTSGKWYLSYSKDEMPEWFDKNAEQFIDIFNDNVPRGCCGGCI